MGSYVRNGKVGGYGSEGSHGKVVDSVVGYGRVGNGWVFFYTFFPHIF